MTEKKLNAAVVVLCILTALTWLVTAIAFGWWPDYTVFYAAAQFAWTDPHLIYDDNAMRLAQDWVDYPGPRPWAYPPSTLLPFLPFSSLPFTASFMTFTISTLVLYVIAARPYVGKAWPIMLLSAPVLYAFWSGQLTFLVGALVLGGIALLPRTVGGVLLGVAAAIKPQLLVLAPLCMLAGGHYRALAGSVVAGLCVLAMSLFLGPMLWLDWFEALPRFVETVRSINILNRAVTPTGFMWNLGLPAWPVTILAGGAMTYAAWMVFRSTDDIRPRAVVLIGGGLWLSPYAMNYELALLCPVAAYYAMSGDVRERASSIALLFFYMGAAPIGSFIFFGHRLFIYYRAYFRSPFGTKGATLAKSGS